jgi:hypothetical protein
MMAANPYMVNNFMQDMPDENASVTGGMNGQMNYVNEYGDEILPVAPPMQMMHNQFFSPENAMKSSEKSRHKEKTKKDKKKRKKDKKRQYSEDSDSLKYNKHMNFYENK